MIDPLAILSTDSTDVDRDIFKVDVSKYAKRRNRLRVKLKLEFTIILGQRTKLTWMHIERIPTQESVMKMVKSLTHHKTDQKYHPLYLYLAKNSMCRLQQVPHVTNTQLVEKIKARVEVVEEVCRGIRVDSKLVKYEHVQTNCMIPKY